MYVRAYCVCSLEEEETKGSSLFFFFMFLLQNQGGGVRLALQGFVVVVVKGVIGGVPWNLACSLLFSLLTNVNFLV